MTIRYCKITPNIFSQIILNFELFNIISDLVINQFVIFKQYHVVTFALNLILTVEFYLPPKQ